MTPAQEAAVSVLAGWLKRSLPGLLRPRGLALEALADLKAGGLEVVESCKHPDRGAVVRVRCPNCRTVIELPADRPDWSADRTCPVCQLVLPFLPEERSSS